MNNERIWEVATLIKLVAGENIPAVTTVATQLKNNVNIDDWDKMDNIIYECYCKNGGLK